MLHMSIHHQYGLSSDDVIAPTHGPTLPSIGPGVSGPAQPAGSLHTRAISSALSDTDGTMYAAASICA